LTADPKSNVRILSEGIATDAPPCNGWHGNVKVRNGIYECPDCGLKWEKPGNYEWVTDEMFDAELRNVIQDEDSEYLLAIPGVYEAVREHYNNIVLTRLEEKRNDD